MDSAIILLFFILLFSQSFSFLLPATGDLGVKLQVPQRLYGLLNVLSSVPKDSPLVASNHSPINTYSPGGQTANDVDVSAYAVGGGPQTLYSPPFPSQHTPLYSQSIPTEAPIAYVVSNKPLLAGYQQQSPTSNQPPLGFFPGPGVTLDNNGNNADTSTYTFVPVAPPPNTDYQLQSYAVPTSPTYSQPVSYPNSGGNVPYAPTYAATTPLPVYTTAAPVYQVTDSPTYKPYVVTQTPVYASNVYGQNSNPNYAQNQASYPGLDLPSLSYQQNSGGYSSSSSQNYGGSSAGGDGGYQNIGGNAVPSPPYPPPPPPFAGNIGGNYAVPSFPFTPIYPPFGGLSLPLQPPLNYFPGNNNFLPTSNQANYQNQYQGNNFLPSPPIQPNYPSQYNPSPANSYPLGSQYNTQYGNNNQFGIQQLPASPPYSPPIQPPSDQQPYSNSLDSGSQKYSPYNSGGMASGSPYQDASGGISLAYNGNGAAYLPVEGDSSDKKPHTLSSELNYDNLDYQDVHNVKYQPDFAGYNEVTNNGYEHRYVDAWPSYPTASSLLNGNRVVDWGTLAYQKQSGNEKNAYLDPPILLGTVDLPYYRKFGASLANHAASGASWFGHSSSNHEAGLSGHGEPYPDLGLEGLLMSGKGPAASSSDALLALALDAYLDSKRNRISRTVTEVVADVLEKRKKKEEKSAEVNKVWNRFLTGALSLIVKRLNQTGTT